jgi:hypothetical protein
MGNFEDITLGKQISRYYLSKNHPGNTESNRYSEEVFKNNLRFAILEQLTSPPQGFEEVVQAHFYIRRHSLIKVLNLYLTEGGGVRVDLP